MKTRSMVALTIAYAGRGFHGYQRQPGLRTIESSLFKCLRDCGCWDGFSMETYSYGGRTDAGANALGQLVSYSPPIECDFTQCLGCLEREGILLWGVRDELPPEFRARQWALYRDYLYIDEISRYSCDIYSIWKILKKLLGLKEYGFLYTDFGPKRIPGEWYFRRRLLYARVEASGDHLAIFVRGESFPAYFMRRLVCFLRNYDCSLSIWENVKSWRPCSAEPMGVVLVRAMVPYYPRFLLGYSEITKWLASRAFREGSFDLSSLMSLFFYLSWLS